MLQQWEITAPKCTIRLEAFRSYGTNNPWEMKEPPLIEHSLYLLVYFNEVSREEILTAEVKVDIVYSSENPWQVATSRNHQPLFLIERFALLFKSTATNPYLFLYAFIQDQLSINVQT